MTEEEARQRVIRAMCPDKVCRTCGEPSRRIVEIDKEGVPSRMVSAATEDRESLRVEGTLSPQGRIQAPLERAGLRTHSSASKTVGFSDCGHDDWRPGKWFDPFRNESGEVMLTLGNIDQ